MNPLKFGRYKTCREHSDYSELREQFFKIVLSSIMVKFLNC